MYPERLRILLSAYACEPGKGSEPGAGWVSAIELAGRHDVTVMTRTNNRPAIEAALAGCRDRPAFIYYDLPRHMRWWKRGARGTQLYYYLWQCGAARVLARSVRREDFDLAQHLTFGRYWMPSALARLPLPFVWGSVGGGDRMPWRFFPDMPLRDAAMEMLRESTGWLARFHAGVRQTARRAAVALAATPATARALRRLGAHDVRVLPQLAMEAPQFERLRSIGIRREAPVRFLSIGRPLYWKGFSLGLRAFAAASLPGSEYWFLAGGDGEASLRRLAAGLGLRERVRFLPRQPTLEKVYEVLGQCDVLVHPALHETFGNVVLEALAAARPVICLDVGGPALQVDASCGRRIPVSTPAGVIRGLSAAMADMGASRDLVTSMGEAARGRIRDQFLWDRRLDVLDGVYREAMAARNRT